MKYLSVIFLLISIPALGQQGQQQAQQIPREELEIRVQGIINELRIQRDIAQERAASLASDKALLEVQLKALKEKESK